MSARARGVGLTPRPVPSIGIRPMEAVLESLLVLPHETLEESVRLVRGVEAEQLLASFTSLWHPRLVADCRQPPRWCGPSSVPSPLDGHLIVVSDATFAQLPAAVADRILQAPRHTVVSTTDRQELLRELLGTEVGNLADGAIEWDFLALGYCYLQLRVLTHRMHYTSRLNEESFLQQLLKAADAALADEPTQCRDALGACFDMLAEERDHYYPVEVHLLDLAVVPPQSSSDCLAADLDQPQALTWLLPAATLARWAASGSPELPRLRERLEANLCGILAGPLRETMDPVLSCESVLEQVTAGHATYTQHLGQAPETFGRRRYGLTLLLPLVLGKVGYRNAWHATLDDGRFPQGRQGRHRWEGPDGSTIDALARAPLDAERPETFLQLANTIADAMQSDYVATIVLARWAGRPNPWITDLRRCAHYTKALGKLVTFEDFFHKAADAGYVEQFRVDDYQSPYLRQDVSRQLADPLSRVVQYWRRRAEVHRWQTMHTWAHLLQRPDMDHLAQDTLAQDMNRSLSLRVDDSLEAAPREIETGDSVPSPTTLDDDLQNAQRTAATALAAALLPALRGDTLGRLVINPHPVVTCLLHEAEVVKVPALGYAWLPQNPRPNAPEATKVKGLKSSLFAAIGAVTGSKARTHPPLARELQLSNEHFEAHVDPHTGGLHALYSYETRGNLLSQKLAFRREAKDGGHNAAHPAFADISVDGIETVTNDANRGMIRTHGRLIGPTQETYGRFVTEYAAQRASRILEISVTLDIPHLPDGDPWKSYYACRFAWGNASAVLIRSLHEMCIPTSARRLESPLFLEFGEAKSAITILTGGLPYHVRSESHVLDTMLVVPGESQRQFRLGVGVGLKQTAAEALHWLAGPWSIADVRGPDQASTGWLFHIDARSVIVTHWQPVTNPTSESTPTTSDGGGARLRLLRTRPGSGPVTLRAFRPITSAYEVDLEGRLLSECSIRDGAVVVDMSDYQWLDLELKWE